MSFVSNIGWFSCFCSTKLVQIVWTHFAVSCRYCSIVHVWSCRPQQPFPDMKDAWNLLRSVSVSAFAHSWNGLTALDILFSSDTSVSARCTFTTVGFTASPGFSHQFGSGVNLNRIPRNRWGRLQSVCKVSNPKPILETGKPLDFHRGFPFRNLHLSPGIIATNQHKAQGGTRTWSDGVWNMFDYGIQFNNVQHRLSAGKHNSLELLLSHPLPFQECRIARFCCAQLMSEHTEHRNLLPQ